MFFQILSPGNHPVLYLSRWLTDAEKNYSYSEKELYSSQTMPVISCKAENSH